MIHDRLDPPAARVLTFAAVLLEATGLDALSLHYVVRAYRDTQALPVPDAALGSLVAAVVAARIQAPISTAEARHVAESAAQHFAVLEDARGAVQRYLVIRGATAEQRARLDTLVRDRWHALRAEVADAA